MCHWENLPWNFERTWIAMNWKRCVKKWWENAVKKIYFVFFFYEKNRQSSDIFEKEFFYTFKKKIFRNISFGSFRESSKLSSQRCSMRKILMSPLSIGSKWRALGQNQNHSQISMKYFQSHYLLTGVKFQRIWTCTVQRLIWLRSHRTTKISIQM